ncbi:protein of unknown function (plasmid) [Candidatus Methylocalor cossyra]|uniref:Acetyl-CoA carboxytransferase n=1 Tax=Candidatus Methylocalor cossyra TaxID=3108543 RepID=A0ABP1CCZ7_9GAMM
MCVNTPPPNASVPGEASNGYQTALRIAEEFHVPIPFLSVRGGAGRVVPRQAAVGARPNPDHGRAGRTRDRRAQTGRRRHAAHAG